MAVIDEPVDAGSSTRIRKHLCFLVYDARSGSTMLAALLNRYRGIAVMPETQFPSRIIEQGCLPAERGQLPDFVGFLYEEPHFRALGIDRQALLGELGQCEFPLSLDNAIHAIAGVYFAEASPEAVVWVIKGGAALFHAQEIIDALPECRFLHIVRDGRAVFASKKRSVTTRGGVFTRTPFKAARQWRERVDRAEKLGRHLIHIRYEDLVLEPEQTLEALCEALGMSGRDCEVEKDLDAYANRIGREQRHLHENLSRGVLVERIEAWREELSAREIAVYEFTARSALQRLGYSPVTSDDRGVLPYLPVEYGRSVLETASNVTRDILTGRLLEKIRRKGILKKKL